MRSTENSRLVQTPSKARQRQHHLEPILGVQFALRVILSFLHRESCPRRKKESQSEKERDAFRERHLAEVEVGEHAFVGHEEVARVTAISVSSLRERERERERARCLATAPWRIDKGRSLFARKSRQRGEKREPLHPAPYFRERKDAIQRGAVERERDGSA